MKSYMITIISTVIICITTGLAFTQTQAAEPKGTAKDNTNPPIVLSEQQQETEQKSDRIVLILVDPNGLPVAGANAATDTRIKKSSRFGKSEIQTIFNRPKVSDENGRIILNRSDVFISWWPPERNAALFIFHEEKQLGAVCEISQKDNTKEKKIVLEPVCHLHGKLTSEDLEEIGWPLYSANVSVKHGDNTILQQHSTDFREDMLFEFLVPPGQYELFISGSGRNPIQTEYSVRAHFKTIPVTVEQGRPNMDLGVINLPGTKLVGLIGKPAPELDHLQGWMKGPPVTFSELKGNVVLLHFGLNHPLALLDRPEYLELHEQFAGKGLTIIAIYNSKSMEELNSKWDEAIHYSDQIKDVPFRVALDGGKLTFVGDIERLGAMHGIYDILIAGTNILIEPSGKVAGSIGERAAVDVIRDMLKLEPPAQK